MQLDKEEQKKQIFYRDARFSNKYDRVWQSVGKCAFCDLNDKYVLYEENGMVLGVPLYAYIDGHLMIIPRRHVESAKELTPKEWETVRKFMYVAKKIIRSSYKLKGMQFIQKDGRDAQSTVAHLHFHCIPFDGPELSTWNFRKLKNTPFENAQIYRRKSKKISELVEKFDSKYKNGVKN